MRLKIFSKAPFCFYNNVFVMGRFCIDVVKLALACDKHLYLFLQKSYLLKIADILWASFKFLYQVGRLVKNFFIQLALLIFLLSQLIEKSLNSPGQPGLFENLPLFHQPQQIQASGQTRPMQTSTSLF